jgi:hypothetical protein
MYKKRWYLVLFVAVVCLGISGTVDAQVYHASQAPNQGYGIQATGEPGNGAARHRYNGYVGVNYRHYSHYPMRSGTNATGVRYQGTGSIVSRTYRPYTTYGYCGYRPAPYRPMPYGYGYGRRYAGAGGGYISGGYAGNGWHVQGGVVVR